MPLWTEAWRSAALDLTDLVLPRGCAGCGREGCALCRGCAASLRVGARPVGASVLAAGAPPTVAALEHRGAAREVVLAWKERGRHDLTPALGAALAGAVVRLTEISPGVGAAETVLVPVPSGRRSRRARGADLTAELARAAAAVLSGTGHERPAVAAGRAGLGLVRQPADQVGLAGTERATNVGGAHRACPALRGARCVIVDDVVTTGSTLRESGRALRVVGAVVLGAVTLTAARPPGGRVADDPQDPTH